MTKQILIDWQRDGLFVAMGSRRGNTVAIETLVNTTGSSGGGGSSTAISTQLFALAKQLDLHKSEATVIAPREVLEFRSLTVPRGESDEIPEMVRFQAQRQMANIGDTWPLDYILLPDQPGSEGVSALAATISPAHMAEIEATCSDLGITLVRVLARPVEIARWGVALGNLAGVEAALVIAVSQTHADLLAVSYGSLVQVRGTRLPEDGKIMASTLVAEIRRTIMAAAGFLNNQPITKVVLIAAPDIAERIESQVAEATGASVAIFDPASVLPAKLPERHELAQRAASRLAGLAGVIHNTTPDKRNIIDLKHCKRREPKKARKREMILAGAGAGLLLLYGFYWWWSSHAELDLQIKIATESLAQKTDNVKTLTPKLKQRADIDNFLAGSLNWLDEMNHIASLAPPSSQVTLANPAFELVADRSGSYGKVVVTAEAKDAATLNELREKLSDKEHAVTGGGPKQLTVKKGDYAWTEIETLRINKPGWDPLAVRKPDSQKPKNGSSTQKPSPTDDPVAGDTQLNKADQEPATAPAQAPSAPAQPLQPPAASPPTAEPQPASPAPTQPQPTQPQTQPAPQPTPPPSAQTPVAANS